MLDLLDGKYNRDLVHVSQPRQGHAEEKRPRIIYAINNANGAHIAIPNNDLSSAHHALIERLCYVKQPGGTWVEPALPETADDINAIRLIMGEQAAEMCAAMRFLDRTSQFRGKMENRANKRDKVSPYSTEQFVDACGGAKKRRYAAAAQSLKDSPFELRDAEVSLFTKDEYMAVDENGNDKRPRGIQTRDPRYHVALGCYLHPVENIIYEDINHIFDPSGEHRTVAKGMNLLARGKTIADMWEQFKDPVGIGIDAESWDEHQHAKLLKNEQKIYIDRLEGTSHQDHVPPLHTLLRHQLRNTGKYRGIDGKIKYILNGKRCSGDINTSLGNIINMCTIIYSYLATKGIRYRLLNDGDDCVLIIENADLEHFMDGFSRWFIQMGVSMTIDGIYYHLEEIEFCQAHPVNGPDGWVLVPNPHKRLYSDLITTKDLSCKTIHDKWLGAVAMCGQHAGSGMPIYQSFYTWLSSGAKPWKPKEGTYYHRYRDDLIEGMNAKHRDVAWSTRMSFFYAYGITPESQLLLEEHFDGLDPPTYSTPRPLISEMAPMMHLVEPKWQDRFD